MATNNIFEFFNIREHSIKEYFKELKKRIILNEYPVTIKIKIIYSMTNPCNGKKDEYNFIDSLTIENDKFLNETRKKLKEEIKEAEEFGFEMIRIIGVKIKIIN